MINYAECKESESERMKCLHDTKQVIISFPVEQSFLRRKVRMRPTLTRFGMNPSPPSFLLLVQNTQGSPQHKLKAKANLYHPLICLQPASVIISEVLHSIIVMAGSDPVI